MRILQTNFHRGWGGQPARILMMSRGLVSLGQEVVIAAPPGSILSERARAAGIPTFEGAWFRKTKHLLSAARDALALARHLREQSYDLIDAHGSQDLWAVTAARALSGRRLPLILTRHNTKRVRAHAANRWLYRRQIDHLIVASRSVLQRYTSIQSAGALAEDRISVVHSAYRTDRFPPGIDGRRARSLLGITDASPIVGVVARLVRDKGHEHLLRAAPAILARHPETIFLFVGTGTLENELRALADSLHLGSSVRFLGFRDDVPEITTALTVSVLPSIDCDASSAALKEALACGVPAVATDIGGAGEILRDGVTGLVVPARDPGRLAAAVLSLLDDPEKAREMGRTGRRDVSLRFTPDRLATETLDVYRKVLASRLRSSS